MSIIRCSYGSITIIFFDFWLFISSSSLTSPGYGCIISIMLFPHSFPHSLLSASQKCNTLLKMNQMLLANLTKENTDALKPKSNELHKKNFG